MDKQQEIQELFNLMRKKLGELDIVLKEKYPFARNGNLAVPDLGRVKGLDEEILRNFIDSLDEQIRMFRDMK